MRLEIRSFWLFSVVVILTLSLYSCEIRTDRHDEVFPYKSFRDIPGVTEEEIRAIEELKKQREYFIYGVPPSTEAFLMENGEVGGYAALFCDWLTALFDIQFIPRVFDWGDLFEELNANTIDFTNLTPTEERLETFIMSDSIAERSVKIIHAQGTVSDGMFPLNRPPRYVFAENSSVIQPIFDLLPPGSFEAVLARDYRTIFEMLKRGADNGGADAFIGINITEAAFDSYGEVYSEEFLPLIFSSVSLATMNLDFKPIISVVTKALKNSGSRFLAEQYILGYEEYTKHKFFMRLTDEEKMYLQNYPIVPFVAQYYSYPLSSFNTYEQKWDGIVFDILDRLENLTGLNFVLVNDNRASIPELLGLLYEGTAYLMPQLIRTSEREDMFLWLSGPYLPDRYALLSKLSYRNIGINDIPHERIGLTEGTAFTETFKSWFPNASNTVKYASESETFFALERGEVDLVMSGQHKLIALTNYYEFSDYKANFLFKHTYVPYIAFNKEKEILSSIIDKAISLIDADTIVNQWMSRTYNYHARLMEAQRSWLIGTTVLSLFILVLISILFFRNRNESKRLEKQVRDRTLELNKYQRELETALEAAKTANISKSVFLANMSHEIRTPMNSIMGFSELAIDDETSAKTKDYLKKIQANVEWLLQIINDILDISKIESGKMEVESIPFDMHELFSSCRTLVMPKAVEKGIMLHFYAEPSVGRKPLGDPTRLRQVFVNLLSNAIKFTNAGMVKLLAEITETTDKSISMHFEIKDSGIGMTPEQIEKIFDPFVQAETGTMRKYGGTGLGLTITKSIVELMGGELQVESTPGIGSKFSFDLVFETVVLTEEELFDKKAVFNEIEKPLFEGEVLVCEDNIMNQQVISEHLVRVGFKVVVADNGKIGLDIIKERLANNEEQFDLIFMDIHMPIMDGFEASAEIIKLNLNIPIVAMTANVMYDEKEVYKASGMPDCVGKPFTSQELWRCLLKYFKQVQPNEEIVHVKRERLEDDRDFFKMLQDLFVSNHQNSYSQIIAAIEKNDFKQAHRITHSLKSNAGQIGLKDLQKITTEVDKFFKDGKNPVKKELLEVLENELVKALNMLK
jgi:signal transduction histidine kinase/DNA-binding response OmpR family regulator